MSHTNCVLDQLRNIPHRWCDSSAECTRSELRVGTRASTWMRCNCRRWDPSHVPGLALCLYIRFALATFFFAFMDLFFKCCTVSRGIVSDNCQPFRIATVLHFALHGGPRSWLAVNFTAPFFTGLVTHLSFKRIKWFRFIVVTL